MSTARPPSWGASPAAARPAAGEIARPRVMALLREALAHRLTVVCAGAGYGKSSALAALVTEVGGVHVRLSQADRDVSVLAARVAVALGVDPAGLGADTVVGLDDPGEVAAAAAALLSAGVQARGVSTLLVLDEVEQVAHDGAAAELLRALGRQATPPLHLVVAGRDVAPLGLVTPHAGDVWELGASDLAFTVDETRVLFEERGVEVEGAAAQTCHARTGGWPAALRLLVAHVAGGRRMDGSGGVAGAETRVWQRFADGVVEAESGTCKTALHVVAVLGGTDPRLVDALGLGLEAPASEVWADLVARGLLASEEAGRVRVSPAIESAVIGRVTPAEAADWRSRAAQWLDEQGQPLAALDHFASGPPDAVRGFLLREGRGLVAHGAGERVVEVLGRVGTGGAVELDALLAEALWAAGDWDGASAAFDKVERSMSTTGVPAPVAWRFGALLYLRGDAGRAAQVLGAVHASDADSADDSLVSGWLSSALWSRGDVDGAATAAAVALRQAQRCEDARALGTAHVAAALVAASRGDRVANEQAYRAALAAVSAAGDSVQAARIHANLASRACEEGDFELAVEHADRSLVVGAGHRIFTGLALTNKAEALVRLGRLDEARACADEAAEAFAACGSMLVGGAQLLLAEVHRQRGDLVQARLWSERALGIATKADDTHLYVEASSALAWIVARDEPEAAREHADQALGRASSLERSAALNAQAWASLCRGDQPTASMLAEQAEAEARRTHDRPRLAAALELRAAAAVPSDPTVLDTATELWRQLGDPVAHARCAVASARLRGAIDAEMVAELAARGAATELGVTAWLADRAREAEPPRITTLGRFTVAVGGAPVLTSAWQSRKARDLLKLLAASAGRPVTRDVIGDALWPGQDPAALGNRLAVAVHTVRRVLDPSRDRPADHFVEVDTRAVTLRVDRVGVDVHDFLSAAEHGQRQAKAGAWDAATEALERAASVYGGDFLEEDALVEWTCDLREQARSTIVSVERWRARGAAQRGDDEGVASHLRRLLERDPYDEDAWTSLVAVEARLRRHGEARSAYTRYVRRMAELDVDPIDYARACRRTP